METEPFVTDVQIMTETNSPRIDLEVDREKAALHGIDTRTILDTLNTSMGGAVPATLHITAERNPLWVKVILPDTSGRTWQP